MEKEKPNYYAILTADVRYDLNLTDKAKLLYAEITALSSKTGKCWASDTYFSELYDCRRETINVNIALLESEGYITIETTPLKRIITLKHSTKHKHPVRKNTQGCEENLTGGCEENLTHNNKQELDLNNKNNKEPKTLTATEQPSFNAFKYFFDKYLELRLVKYIATDNKKEAGIIHNLFKKVGEVDFKRAVENMLKSTDKFKAGGYTVYDLNKNINVWLAVEVKQIPFEDLPLRFVCRKGKYNILNNNEDNFNYKLEDFEMKRKAQEETDHKKYPIEVID